MVNKTDFFFSSLQNLANLIRRFQLELYPYFQVAEGIESQQIYFYFYFLLALWYLNFLLSDNGLFSSGRDSDLEEGKENGTPAVRTHVAPKQTPPGAAVAGGGKGLFDDDEEEDDDFFGGKSPKKPDSCKSTEIGV